MAKTGQAPSDRVSLGLCQRLQFECAMIFAVIWKNKAKFIKIDFNWPVFAAKGILILNWPVMRAPRLIDTSVGERKSATRTLIVLVVLQ